MSATNLFIPRRINVGFQERQDTYTGKLAYVIYFDEKGKLRKEASWNSWRDSKIPNIEYENEPTEGFVLNKKVGGYCYHWSDFRQSYVRVYDPRGFEIEITIPNLLYILENTNCIKGKGLEGKFVYGWDGTDLVLMPLSSPDYEQLTKLNNTRFANKRICAKDLKVGATYLTKSGENLVFLGKFDYYESTFHFDGKFFETRGQMEKYAEKNGKPLYRPNDKYDRYNRDINLYDYKVGTCSQRYFFSAIGDMAIKPIKSVPNTLIDAVSEECISDFAQRFEILESNTMYSPHDEARDLKVYYTLEDFCNKIDEGSVWVGFHAEYCGEDVSIGIRKQNCGKITCERNGFSSKFDPCDLFPRNNELSWKPMFPVEPKEVFDKFKFFYTEQYLTNGKYYRRVW